VDRICKPKNFPLSDSFNVSVESSLRVLSITLVKVWVVVKTRSSWAIKFLASI
jgi:hypothetical protein